MTESFKISENTKEKAIKYFEDKKREKTPAYAIFQADEADTVVTLYESGKMVFQGVSADIDASIWKDIERKLNPGKKVEEKKKKETKNKIVDKNLYYASSIGSDEVGTGDFFGPLVVASAFVKKDDISFLENLGAKDSKKLTDEKILEIAPIIMSKIPNKILVVSNTQYNEFYEKYPNMNKMKAILHNKVLIDLVSKYHDYDYIIVDQFAKENLYYSYLKEAKEVCKNITFTTKAEDKTLSVACASILARYTFLKEFDKISKDLNIILPKGAGETVDIVAGTIVNQFGFDKLKSISKMNFKNIDKLKKDRI